MLDLSIYHLQNKERNCSKMLAVFEKDYLSQFGDLFDDKPRMSNPRKDDSGSDQKLIFFFVSCILINLTVHNLYYNRIRKG